MCQYLRGEMKHFLRRKINLQLDDIEKDVCVLTFMDNGEYLTYKRLTHVHAKWLLNGCEKMMLFL